MIQTKTQMLNGGERLSVGYSWLQVEFCSKWTGFSLSSDVI